MSFASRVRVCFPSPEKVEVLTEEISAPGEGEVLVRTLYSAISPGTERLVYEGSVLNEMNADVSIQALDGEDLTYPLSYGYACAGEVEAVGEGVDHAWKGTRVFAFHPHASRFKAKPSTLVRLPNSIQLTNAIFIPTLETAVNLVMDGRPVIGEHVMVFGQGIVGLFTTHLLDQFPLARISTIEKLSERRHHSEALGATESKASLSDLDGFPSADALSFESAPQSSTEGADLVYELTGHPQVLNDAIQGTGFGGRIVVGSWYGEKQAPMNLGERFHRSRIQIISSQVSTIAPSYRGRWTKERRMSVVLDLLSEVDPSRLISNRFHIEDAPLVYDQLSSEISMLQPVFVYE